MNNKRWKRILVIWLCAVLLMSNLSNTGSAWLANTRVDGYEILEDESNPDTNMQEVEEDTVCQEEVIADEIPVTSETAAETEALGPVEEEQVVDEPAEEMVSEEDEEKVAVTVTMQIVDENGGSIDPSYDALDLPAFTGELGFSAAPYENDVVKVCNVEGTSRYYAEPYTYDYAEMNGVRIASISKEEAPDGGFYYAYSVDGSEYTQLTEDTVLVLHYTNSRTKTVYSYEDTNIKVTATLDSADAIPDDAEFVVTPVTENSDNYNYDAYLKALNDTAEAEEEEEDPYTCDNTMLYDLAFMVDKTDEAGNVIAGEQVEVEPTVGSVRVDVQFKSAQLSEDIEVQDAEHVEVRHLKLKTTAGAGVDATKEAVNISASDVVVEELSADVSVESTESVAFTMDSFSVISVTDEERQSGIYSSDINFKSILGDAVEYGIVANTYDQSESHTETNFAVYTYIDNQNQVHEEDLTNEASIPYIVGHIVGEFRFGKKSSIKDEDADRFHNDIYMNEEDRNKVSSDNEVVKYHMIFKEPDTLKTMVDDLMNGALNNSQTLAELEPTPTTGIKVNGSVIDTTGLPDNVTLVIDAGTIFKEQSNWQNKPVIKKLPGQNIIINVGDNYGLNLIREYGVEVDGKTYYTNEQTDSGNDSDMNKNLDTYILQHITWNVTTSKVTLIQDSAGLFLFPNASEVSVRNSAGWLVTSGKVTSKGEWHFIYHGRTYESDKDKEVKQSIEATKEFNDWSAAEGFTFVLRATDGAPMPADAVDGTVTKTATEENQTVNFGEISYTKEGTYEYTITEEDGGIAGITYDTNPHKVTVEVTADPDTNELTATVDYGDGASSLTITNTYYAAAEAEFNAQKSFDRWDIAKDFTFVLTAEDGAPMPEEAEDGTVTKTVTEENQTVNFGAISYAEEGTYEYTITEVNDGVGGVTYDAKAHEVVVKVTKNEDTKKLEKTVKYDGEEADKLTITNTFNATTAQIRASKNFNAWNTTYPGISFADTVFEFVLAPVNGAPMPETVSEDGKITKVATKTSPTVSFDEITYEKAGTYTYTVTETKGGIAGITYDTNPHTVKVEVTADPNTNELTATVSYGETEELEIVNTYYTAAVASVSVAKGFDSWQIADHFTFTLTAGDDQTPMPEGTLDGATSISVDVTEQSPIAIFSDITYSESGLYLYTITEVDSHIPGVTYDKAEHLVVVEVTKDENTRSLLATVLYDGSQEQKLDITNTFTSTSANLKVTKDFNNWDKATAFTFVLTANDGAPMPKEAVEGSVMKMTTQDSLTASFGEITYDRPGTYTYTIKEINGGETGVEYDTTEHTVTVDVTADQQTNKMDVAIKYDGEEKNTLTITNTYYEAAEAEFNAQKSFDRWDIADEFTFVLTPVGDAPMPEEAEEGKVSKKVTEKSDTASFGNITFEEPGTYNYKITEVDDHVGGITYDAGEHTVSVEVTRNKDTKKLETAVTYDGQKADKLTITNTFTAAGAEIEATKEFNDWGKADAFTFILTAIDDAPMPEDTERDGTIHKSVTQESSTISFGEISYDRPGTYKYEVTEVNDGIIGIDYDEDVHEVTVDVTADPTTNELKANVNYGESGKLILSNTYYAAASVSLEAQKEFNDWGKAENFTFTLAAVDGAPMPEAAQDGEISKLVTESNPVASFGEITYPQTGTYEYVITEVNDHIDGITYDESEHQVVVEVTKDEEAKVLTALVTYDSKEALTITNTFTSAQTSLKATKQINDWGSAEAFTFVLTPVGDAPMPQDAVDGTVAKTVTKDQLDVDFGSIIYDTAGTYEYTIHEVNDGVAGITYDTTAHKAVVTVTADPDTNELSTEVTYDGKEALVITNRYDSAMQTIQATKNFNRWDKAKSFTFTLSAVDDAPMPEGAINGKISANVTQNAPTAVFGSILFETPGTYEYRISEVNSHIRGITYDTKEHKVVITVSKGEDGHLISEITYDGEESLVITNTYTEHKSSRSAKTGDGTDPYKTGLMVALAGVAFSAILAKKRKRSKS